MEELVVLVDNNNQVLGTVPKDTVHSLNTPLHRGFSLFLFNSKNELLLTRRALTKKTFPGVWTNTVCGHPGPGEDVTDAAKRRLKDELGIELPLARSDLLKRGSTSIRVVVPYRYRFADAHGIVENEICPIVVAYSDAQPKPNREEVEEHRWIRWGDFLEEIRENPQNFSPWSREEAVLIVPLI